MNRPMRCLLLLLPLLLCLDEARAQADTATYIDIGDIRLSRNISAQVGSLYLPNTDTESPAKMLEGKTFTRGLIHKGTIPASRVTSTLFLKFHVFNSSDSVAKAYFFPGFYYKRIRLFYVAGDQYERIPDVYPVHPDHIGFREIKLGAHDSATILAELQFVRTYINTVRPRLVHPEYLPAFFSNLGSRNTESDLMTYIFCGLLLMMILYSLANYLQGANKEFLYYSGYAFFISVMLFTKAMFSFHTNPLSYFFESYMDFILQGLGIMFYMIFMQRFLETRTRYPFLYKFYNVGIVMLLLSMLSYTFFHYFTDQFVIDNGIENVTKLLLLVMVLVFLFYSVRKWNDRLMRYLFWGNLCLFIFSMFSQLIIMNPVLRELPGVLGSSLFYYEVGLLLELVFFLAGLNQKNRRKIIEQTREREELKAQNKLKEYEKQLAVYKAQQQERERISADMHDELGSGMTAIRLMSEIARNKMKENTPVEIDKISASADDVLNKMNAIIWSMNSGNDTLDNLVSYIRAYAIEFFENTSIDCKVNTPTVIPDLDISGDKRRNVFLSIKETLHNALKHSKARLVIIDIAIDQELRITIRDNGVGIDPDNLRRFGNGLKNIRKRMESIGGRVTIGNEEGLKTVLTLDLDIAVPAEGGEEKKYPTQDQ
jgi:signal transduction histidine kinase